MYYYNIFKCSSTQVVDFQLPRYLMLTFGRYAICVNIVFAGRRICMMHPHNNITIIKCILMACPAHLNCRKLLPVYIFVHL